MRKWQDITMKERIGRWEQAIRVLRELTPHQRRKHFDMSFFGKKTECGTIGCTAGLCGLDPWFRRRGFKMDFTLQYFSYQGYSNFDSDSQDVTDFFGAKGAESILFNGERRPVGTVIREIKTYIRELKE